MALAGEMKLDDWFEVSGKTPAQFAKETGLSRAMISLLCRDMTWLSRETARKIFLATDGMVTPIDFMGLDDFWEIY